MIVSPIKSIAKHPLVDPWQNSFLSERQRPIGKSIQLTDTDSGDGWLALYGETVGKKVVFGTNYIRIDGATNPFTTGTLTISGCATTANNKSAAIVSVSGQYVYVAASTFTAAVETQGSITDGTNTLQIAVSPSAPQTLTSLTSFDLFASGKNLLNPAGTATSGSANATRLFDGMSLVVNTTTPSTTWAYSTFKIRLKPNTTYRVSALSTRTGATGGGIAIFNNNLSVQLGGSASTLNPNTSFTTDASGLTAFAFYAKQSGTGNDSATFTNIQLELGSVATTYETYNGTEQTITLKDTSGNALEDRGLVATYNTDGSAATWTAQDKVVRDVDGKYKLASNTVRYTVQSSDVVQMITSSTNVDIARTSVFANAGFAYNEYAKVISDKYVGGTQGNRDNASNANKVFNVPEAGKLDFIVPKGTTLAAAQAAIAGTVIIYPMVSTLITELHSDNQAAFIAAAKSYDNLSNISLGVAYGQIEFDQWSKEAVR